MGAELLLLFFRLNLVFEHVRFILADEQIEFQVKRERVSFLQKYEYVIHQHEVNCLLFC